MKPKPYKKDGKIYYKFNAYLGINPKTGKPIRTNRQGFNTKKEAEMAYYKLLSEYKDKIEGKITFEKVYKEWLLNYEKGVADATYNKVTSYFNNHILPSLGHYYIHKITLQDVQISVNKWAEHYSDVKPLRNYTRKVFRFAIQNKYIKENPCEFVMIPKKEVIIQENKIENYFEKEELLEFLKYVEKDLPFMWYAYFRLIAYSGIRRGESLALKWSDIDLKKKTMSIHKNLSTDKKGKTKLKDTKNHKNRTIQLDDLTLQILRKHKLNQKPYKLDLVFPNTSGNYMALTKPAKKINKITKNHKLKKVTLHGLRHTHCSLLFAAGADLKQVQIRMGHRDIKTTLNIYTHLTKEKHEETVNKFMKYMSV